MRHPQTDPLEDAAMGEVLVGVRQEYVPLCGASDYGIHLSNQIVQCAPASVLPTGHPHGPADAFGSLPSPY